jgi:hypothetical protein
VEWLGMGDALEEVHELFANAALALVAAHLALIALLSVLRRRNLARPMLTGRAEGAGPDLVKTNRSWLAVVVVVVCLGFVGWQTTQGGTEGASATQGDRRSGHHDDDD